MRREPRSPFRMNDPLAGTSGSLHRDSIWPIAIVVSAIVLLPAGRSSELPVAIAAIAGLVLAAQRRFDLAETRRALVLFACYWLPALLSGFWAIEPSKSWTTIASLLRFAPFAVFVIHALRHAKRWPGFVEVVAAVVALWVIDAWVQILFGYSLGGAAEAERISGVFGAGNLKLGPTLAVLSPFVLLAARARWGRPGLAVAFLVLAVPILLAGSRAAWISYGLVVLILAAREAGNWRRFAVLALGLAVVSGALAFLAWHDSSRFDARIDRSLLALRGTPLAIDEASAGRLSIWHAAVGMIRARPLTGVGVRGFRYAYPAYAAKGDRFVDPTSDTGASHAHQIVLEILSETGIVGLVFWITGAGFAVMAWRRAGPAARERGRAPALALVAMCFPLNSHLAFYSAWWGLLFWWLVAVYVAALAAGGSGGDA